MTELDPIDALAAEYVLGTLDAQERAEVAVRCLTETGLAAAIAAWERRFAPWSGLGLAVAPPADLLAHIEARLATSGAGKVAAGGNVVGLLEARVRRWRRLAIGASALAACLTLAIGLRETVLAPSQQRSFVGVFHRDDELPAFLLTVDLASRQVTVRPVGATRQPGRTYQLWIASDQLGPAPRSLGLLGDGAGPANALLTAYEPALLQRATFGVSLEPAGGSPTGQPTSPALHTKLHPATP